MSRKTFLVILSVFLLTLAASADLLASEVYVPPPDQDKPPRVTVQDTYQQKCSRCHGVDRPDNATKAADAWKSTVDRMRAKDTAWISGEEAEKIASFLAGRSLAAVKCARCHPANRADVLKTDLQWRSTVDRMQEKEPSWITDAEKELIRFYLTDVYLREL